MKRLLGSYQRIIWALVPVVMLVGMAFAIPTSALTVQAGRHDAWYVRQWYDPEVIGERTMRWSEPRATVEMPAMRAGWHVAELWLLNGRPDGLPAQVVTVTSAGLPPQQLSVAGWQLRRYALLWRAPLLHWSDAWQLDVATPVLTTDQRQLGILMAQWRTTPLQTGWPWQSYVWLVLTATALAVWAVVTLLDVRVWWLRTLFPLGVVVALLGALILRASDTLPWLHWPAVCAVAGIVWQAWMRLMGWVTRQPSGRLGVAGRLLPLLCGSAWLVMPWLQRALIESGIYVRGFAVYPTQLLGWTTAAMAVIAGIALLSRRYQWPWWESLSQWAVLWVSAVSSLVYLVMNWQGMAHVGSADFDVWVIAARHWLATGSLYDVPQIAGDVFGYVYKYPPLYGMFFIPLASFNEMELLRIYRIIDVGLIVWTAYIWLRIIRPVQWMWWVGALLVCVNLNPVLETLKYGQIDVVVLWLCTIIYWCLYHDHDDAAGWIVALLISIKMYPAVFLIWFVLQRRWYAVRGTIMGGIVLNLVGMVVLGWRDYYIFVFDVLPIIGGTTAYVENQTIAAFIARLVAPSYPLAPFTDAVWAPITTLVSLGVLAGLFVVCAKRFATHHQAFAMQFAVVVMMTALAIPVAWIGYQVPLWLVLIVVLWYAAPRTLPWYQATLLATSFALIGFGNFLSFVFAVDVGWVTIVTDSYKLYGMVMLTGLLCWWIWQAAREDESRALA